MSNQPRKSSPLGDLQLKEKKDENGNWIPDYYEVRDKDGNPTGELLEQYQIKVYIPDDVDELKCGEPSIILKKDQYINARALSEFEKGRLPDGLKVKDQAGNVVGSKVACKLSIQVGERKQYPKKER